MDEFPDPDEEYELMHADEIEMMNELDDFEPPCTTVLPKKSKRSLNFGEASPAKDVNESQVTSTPPTLKDNRNLYNTPDGCIPLEEAYHKRTVSDLFGDIDDIDFDIRSPKKQKILSKEEKQDILIKYILDKRKELKEQRKNFCTNLSTNRVQKDFKDYVSRQIPDWPFVAVSGNDGHNLYLRYYPKEEFDEQINSIHLKAKTTGLLNVPYQDLYKEAMEQILRKNEKVSGEENKENIIENELWVEKYKPKTYLELLSDESTNRALLHWLKLWDKVVFNREPVLKKANKLQYIKVYNKDFNKDVPELDDSDRPQQKVALLCGPPGLGKTTLAHTIAKQAGYNVVEVNASDDRSAAQFKTALEAATQMKSVVMEENPRPNCLVLDEIDGAPQASIELLVKFVTNKGEKKKGKKKVGGILKRPVICICNDVYVPALRSLRQIAFTLHFPPTATARLGERLMEICKFERIQSDLGTMMTLSDKAHNDIRSCLSVLAMLKAKGKRITLSQIMKARLGLKDRQQGLFSVWQTIFHISTKKKSFSLHSTDSSDKQVESAVRERFHTVLRVVQSYGDYDRLAMGVYENFLTMKSSHDSSLYPACRGLDWFCFHDLMSTAIQSSQIYALYPYLPYSFVSWHRHYASISWPKIHYPSTSYEMSQKKVKISQIVDFAFSGMPPHVQAYQQRERLILDTTPYLLELIIPNIRPVSVQLHTPSERSEVERVVHAMVDYNLNYTQERTVDGNYIFNLDPNLEEVGNFKERERTRNLGYPGRQMIAKEIETERLRRFMKSDNLPLKEPVANEKLTKGKENVNVMNSNSPNTKSPLPSHLQKLTPKALRKKKLDNQARDFFGRIVEKTLTKEQEKAKTDEIVKSDVWFHFKEGYNNAVRKNVYMSDLM